MSKWETVRLGDVATYINGYAFKPSDWSDKGLPIIRIQNLTGNDYETNYYSGDYDERYEVNNGDVLISWSASLGVYEWKRDTALLNQHIFKVVFDKLGVDKSYFMHTVTYLLDDMTKETHGSTMKHITKPRFDNTPFPYPPLKIQRQIAENLDKVTHLIDLCNSILDKLDLLVKSRFVEMFGTLSEHQNNFDVYKFEDITEKITDGEHSTPHRVEKGIFLLSARNILNHSLQLSDVDYIDENEYNRIANRIVPQEGDVLVSCSGTIGRCCAIPKGFKCQMVRSVALLRFQPRVNPIYAEHMITSIDLQNQIKSAKTASSQANLFQGKIAKLRGLVPPLPLQEQFAAFVEQTNKSKLAVKQVLEKAETLKKALMQKYFEKVERK